MAERDCRVAICPGTFDPVTSGHLDIIGRACRFFDRFYVAVAVNPYKNPLFTLEERIDLLKKSVSDLPNVEVVSFDCLLVDLAERLGANAIVKGLRAISDFEYEFQMAQINSRMDSRMETFFVMSSTEYSFLSSSAVRELGIYGGDIRGLVPPQIEGDLKELFRQKFGRVGKGA
jgi:pantetheine-phosphate adenylyltransferase